MEKPRTTPCEDLELSSNNNAHQNSTFPHDSKDEIVTVDAQHGVQAIEAAAGVWGKWDLVIAYGLIWLVYFVTSINEVVVRALTPFVTSSFALHSLTATSTVISSIIERLSKIPLAKIVDIWGRPQGIAIDATFLGPRVHHDGQLPQCRDLCRGVGVFDCRLVQVGDGVLVSFAIIVPVVVVPLIVVFMWNQHKAKKLGLVPPPREKTCLKEFAIQFDSLGVFLLAAGMALLLLPMNVYSYQTDGWRSPMIIAMIVVGGLLVIAFVLFEKFWAPVNFIPMHLLGDRTVLSAGIMLVFVFFNSAIWGSYFNSMLLVAWNQSLTKATYISNIYRVGSCFSALILGFFIRWTGRFKWVAGYYALPLMMLGVGLMIQFRQPNVDIGLVIMTQVFVAFAGGPVVTSAELAMMAPVGHQHIAAILAILDLFGSVGTALGSTVSAAIWTGVFPAALARNLPPGTPVDTIYSSIYVQLGYRLGTPIRVGISYAYAEAQRYMLIAAITLLGAAWVCTWLWRDIKIKDIHQIKGSVV
ncbi:major facilitator superfamily transporter [Seiridium cupressi]